MASMKDEAVKLRKNIDAVYEAGQKSEYDRFWDEFQQNGQRIGYDSGFAGTGWTVDTFKPKYDIKPANAYQLFRVSKIDGDLVEILERLGVALDFSECANLANAFYYCAFTRIGVVDATAATNVAQMFGNANSLVTVDKLILKSDGTQVFTNSFVNCEALQNITIEGVIGTDINIVKSPLSLDSMKNIIYCLANYAGTDNEYKYTVKFSATSWTQLEADSVSPSGTTWQEYVRSLGWTI